MSPITTVDAVEADVELLGDDLRDRDVDALAHVHLAEEGGDAAVGQDRDPGIELVGQQRAACRRAAPCASAWLERRTAPAERDADDERAGGLEEIAARRSMRRSWPPPYAAV